MSPVLSLFSTIIVGVCMLYTPPVFASSGYGDEGYPDDWEDYSGKCKYANKTPINIIPTINAELPELRVLYQGSINSIKNHGHTMTLLVDTKNAVISNNEFYQLNDIHIHVPSENHVKGQEFPMEIHFVHISSNGHKLVVSVFYQYGGVINETTQGIVDNMPELGERYTLKRPLELGKLLPEKRHYYRFNGASAEDCKEGIMWFVFKDPVLAPEEVIKAVHDKVGSNDRNLSPSNNRIILQ